MFFNQSRSTVAILVIMLLIMGLVITGCGSQTTKGESTNGGDKPSEQPQQTADQTKSWEPTEEVEFVVHNSPGSSTDAFVRTIADALTKNGIVKQKIVVNNRPGGGGVVARKYLASKAGNPHVLAGLSETYIVRGFSNKDDISPLELTPIALQIGDPTTVIVPVNSKYKTINDVLEDARNRPGQVSQGSGAVGAGEWILARMIENKADVKFNFVSFKTGGESIVAILGGHVDVGLGNPVQVIEHIKAGNLRMLAIGTEKRSPMFPDVPTLKESGVDAVNFGLRGWLAAPDIKEDEKKFWIDAMKRVMNTPEVKKWMEDNLMVDVYAGGDDFVKFINTFWEERKELFEEAGLTK